jgi:hypothetical protein
MKNSTQYGASILLALVLLFAIGSVVYTWRDFNKGDHKKWGEKTLTKSPNIVSDYTFKTFKRSATATNQQLFVEIYKKGDFVQTILAGNGTDISGYTVSPDNKYVAFKTTAGQGGCVVSEKPKVIDLTLMKVKEPARVVPATTKSTLEKIAAIVWTGADGFDTATQYGDKSLPKCGPASEATVKYTVK